MDLVAKIDDYGKPAWIVLMVLGFIVFWPIGLALLFYMIWSGRMGCWKNRSRKKGPGTWYHPSHFGGSSGNAAFDEYRAETLRRLEDEQKEFVEFLERLRKARDKAEFDQFMSDRKRRAAEKSDIPDTPEKPDDTDGFGDLEPEAPRA